MRAVCLPIWMVETMAGKWKQIAKNLVGMPITNSSTQNTYLTKRRGRNGAGVIHQLKRITIRPLPEDRNTWGPKPRPAFSVSKRAFYPTSSSGPGKPYITTRSRAVNVAWTLPDGDEWNTLSTQGVHCSSTVNIHVRAQKGYYLEQACTKCTYKRHIAIKQEVYIPKIMRFFIHQVTTLFECNDIESTFLFFLWKWPFFPEIVYEASLVRAHCTHSPIRWVLCPCY
jgi:hypothetical protein